MIFMSFDTSSSSTGYAVFENGNLVDSGVIDLKKVKNSDTRMDMMVSEIFNQLSDIQPDCVVWETPVVVRNPKTQRMLTMIVGAIMGYCIGHSIQYYELRPTEWRSLCKTKDEKLPRKRDELKQWSVSKVKELFEIETNDDEADSILLGFALIKKYND